MEQIVALSVKHYASDLHLCTGEVPRWRKAGVLETMPVGAPPPEQLLASWLSAEQKERLASRGQLDFAVTLADGQRLRANAFHQRQGISLALRILPWRCPELAELEAPEHLTTLLRSDNGLLLVTGATGSGKSTTLAAMVDFLNQGGGKHIISLEDPIEYLHGSAGSLIQQREVGVHCGSFAAGLRAALREDPDVILLGELRDSETIRLALTAAETGHLVLATLHTRGAAQAVARITDVFAAEEKPLIAAQLADCLRGVVAQRLVPACSGGRVALFELLVNTPAVACTIRDGKNHQLPGLIQTGLQSGMQDFARSLAQRRLQGRVAPGDMGDHDS